MSDTDNRRVFVSLACCVLMLMAAMPTVLAQEIACGGSPATIVGTAGDDDIKGTSGNDVIAALEGNDKVRGSKGQDTICANAGNDDVDGGPGIDIIGGGDGDDIVQSGPGDDFVVEGNGNDHSANVSGLDGLYLTNAPGGVIVDVEAGTASGLGQDTFSNIIWIEGSDHDDEIRGSSGDDVLLGGLGNDRVDGREGDDEIFGEAGDDLLDGGLGASDSIRFIRSAAGIKADLSTGIATGEGNDTFTNIEELFGSDFDDELRGDSQDNQLHGFGGVDLLQGGTGEDNLTGGLGDDTIDGAEGIDDTVFYVLASGPVEVDLNTDIGTGADGTDTLIGIEHVGGSDFDDRLFGSDEDDILIGRAGDDIVKGRGGDLDILSGDKGNDTVDGGPGNLDFLAFGFSSTGVDANLKTGRSTGEGKDTFKNLEAIGGSDHDDVLIGDKKSNWLVPEKGDDSVDGGGGYDMAFYWFAEKAVTVDLAKGEASGNGKDVLKSIEGVQGGDFDDVLRGDDKGNILWGEDGNDTIDGRGGNDELDGEEGDDTLTGGPGDYDSINYSEAVQGVAVDLAAGTGSGSGQDVIRGIEGVSGTPFDDELVGSDGVNYIFGSAGDDNIQAGAGDDEVDGGDDNDVGDAGDGSDTCVAAEAIASCEEADNPRPPPLKGRSNAGRNFSKRNNM